MTSSSNPEKLFSVPLDSHELMVLKLETVGAAPGTVFEHSAEAVRPD